MTEVTEEKARGDWRAFFIILAAVIIIATTFLITSHFIKKNAEEKNKLTYNGFEFTKNADGFWVTYIMQGGQSFILPSYYNPKQLENITYDANITRYIDQRNQFGGHMFITIDPNYPSTAVLAFTEIRKIIGEQGVIGISTSAAYYILEENATNKTYDLPIITCKNATIGHPVIWLKVSNRTEASMIHNCIILEAKSADQLIEVADLFVYKVLKIM
jgi:hypothetical protein